MSPQTQINTYVDLAFALIEDDNPIEAERHARAALELYKRHGLAIRDLRVRALSSLAIALAHQGRLVQGLKRIRKAAQLAQAVTVQPTSRFKVHWNLATQLNWAGKPAEAETTLRDALTLACCPGERFMCLHYLMIILRSENNLEEAKATGAQAVTGTCLESDIPFKRFLLCKLANRRFGRALRALEMLAEFPLAKEYARGPTGLKELLNLLNPSKDWPTAAKRTKGLRYHHLRQYHRALLAEAEGFARHAIRIAEPHSKELVCTCKKVLRSIVEHKRFLRELRRPQRPKSKTVKSSHAQEGMRAGDEAVAGLPAV